MVRASRKRKHSAARYKSGNDGGVAQQKMAVDQWLDLPRGPLDEILSLLNPIDVLLVIPLVCKYWGRIFLKRIFCKQKNTCLDFRPLKSEPYVSVFYQPEDENSRAMKLMNLLVGVMHAFASEGQSDANTDVVKATPIIEIAFPADLPLHDRHLVYLAERCPELKYIYLPCAKNITGIGISRAMRFWSHVERMTYGPFDEQGLRNGYLTRCIEEIGINCKNLKSLELSGFDLHWDSADVMVWNLKFLKQLGLRGVHISKYGLQIFLSRCRKLEVLNIKSCFYIHNKSEVYPTRYKILRIQKGRRTKWSTNVNGDKTGKSYTSKELVNLIWKPKKIDM